MRGFRSARGESKLGTILLILICFFVIYEGFKFGPVLFAQYEFGDLMNDEAKFSRAKKAGTLQDSLANHADRLGLPIKRSEIQVSRQPNKTRIQVKYRLSVEWLPGKVYTWDVDQIAESVLF